MKPPKIEKIQPSKQEKLQDIINVIYLGIESGHPIVHNIKDKTIKFKKYMPNNYENLVTGILCKDRLIKMQWKLIANPGYGHWTLVDIYVIGSKIKRGYYMNSNRIHDKFIDEEVYGVYRGINCNNLTKTKKAPNNNCLKLTEGPILVTFDQQKGSLIFKSQNWEYCTNKLKKDEDYRVEISMKFQNAELECKFLE